MTLKLTNVELRVLGVLIEKSLTVPGGYPMTMNSIASAANQKQNRDPVMSVPEGDVARAIGDLSRRNLVTQAPPGPGDRSNKYEHRAVETLGWDRRQQSVMAELMLRGRQTAGELRTRCSRMTPLPDLAAVSGVLGELMQHDPPFVTELPREPNRSVTRFCHLIGVDAGTEGDGRMTGTAEHSTAGEPGPAPALQLADRVLALEQRVHALAERLSRLEPHS